MKLFYLAHAGGTAASIYKWSCDLKCFIEPIPIGLSGHGVRYGERSYLDFREAVKDIFNIFRGKVNNSDYVLVGHSMGATLIYELYYEILRNNMKPPVHIFFSGSKPPYTRNENEKISILDDDAFLNEVKKYGGISDEMVNSDKFKRIFIPIIKEDYRILENYEYIEKIDKIKCNISVMYGEEDLNYDDVKGWRSLASVCYFKKFVGGHFYIDSNMKEFANYINDRILQEYKSKEE